MAKKKAVSKKKALPKLIRENEKALKARQKEVEEKVNNLNELKRYLDGFLPEGFMVVFNQALDGSGRVINEELKAERSFSGEFTNTITSKNAENSLNIMVEDIKKFAEERDARESELSDQSESEENQASTEA